LITWTRLSSSFTTPVIAMRRHSPLTVLGGQVRAREDLRAGLG